MAAVSRATRARRRALAGLLLLCAIGIGWFVIYGGRALQHEDALRRADAVFVPGGPRAEGRAAASFVLAGTRAERPLEAVELYRQGYAPWIVLSPGRPEPSEIWLARQG